MYEILLTTRPAWSCWEQAMANEAHVSAMEEAGLDVADMRALACVEGRLYFGPDGEAPGTAARAALVMLQRLPAAVQQTEPAIRLRAEIDDEIWFEAARAAMRAQIGGACRLSRSGASAIFAPPQCGRADLSCRREFAQAQLSAAGIEVAA